MRKLVASLFISLDGVAESPDQWQFDVFDDDMGEEMSNQLATQDTYLMGRVTYEEWAAYWPTSTDEPFASAFNSTPKYIVSNTLDHVAWGSYDTVHLIKGDPTAEINRLKALPGKNIAVGGSPTLIRSLLHMGLIDELILIVHPVIVGKGKRLFHDGDDLRRMNLVRSKITGSGAAILAYTPRPVA